MRLSNIILPLSLIGLTSCLNVYDSFDSPSGDEQILSAARAEFDKGNLEEARSLYQKLGTNDSALAELAFVDLNEAGVTMSALTKALQVSSGDSVGSILTTISETIQKNTSVTVAAKRASLESAYARVGKISNQQVRGFVRFLLGISIAAEVLSENTYASDGVISKTDIITSTSTCTTSNIASCLTDSGCDIKSGSGISVGTDSQFSKFTSSTDTSITIGSPTYIFMTGALLGATAGLTELAITSGDSYSLVTSLNSNGVLDNLKNSPSTATSRCFLTALVNSVGVGE